MDIKKFGLYLQSLFYIVAGVNHFINPDFYIPLIPDYLQGVAGGINFLSGAIEIGFGAALLVTKTRKLAAYGIVLMLIAFVPSHVYFIRIGSCIDGGLCVDEWIGWGRLVVIHPLLIWWVYDVKNFGS